MNLSKKYEIPENFKCFTELIAFDGIVFKSANRCL